MTVNAHERWILAAALFAILLGVVARLAWISVNDFWFDELIVLERFANPKLTLAELAQHWSSENTPPFYYLALRAWRGLAGDGAVRMLNVLASLAAIAFTALWPPRATPKPAAWLAAAFLAVSLASLEFAHEVRAYAFVYGLAGVATALSLRLADWLTRPAEEQAPWPIPALGAFWLTGVAAAYSHFFGLLWMGALTASLMALALLHRRWKPCLAVGLAGVLIAAAAAPYLLWRASHGPAASPYPDSTNLKFLLTHAALAGRAAAGSWPGLALVAAVLGWSGFACYRSGGLKTVWSGQPIPTLHLLLLAFGVLCAASTLLGIFYWRNALLALPAVAYLFGLGLWGLLQSLPARLAGAVSLSALLLLAALGLPGYANPTRGDLRGASALIGGLPGCAGAPIATPGKFADLWGWYIPESARPSLQRLGSLSFYGRTLPGDRIPSTFSRVTVSDADAAAMAATLRQSTCPAKLLLVAAAPFEAEEAASLVQKLDGEHWERREFRGGIAVYLAPHPAAAQP